MERKCSLTVFNGVYINLGEGLSLGITGLRILAPNGV